VGYEFVVRRCDDRPVASRPRVRSVHETVLYAEDVDAAAAFYGDVLGLRQIASPDEHSAAFRTADGVVLLFDPRRTGAAGRFVPSHGSSGPGHVAFAVDPGELDAFALALPESGITIEREIAWPLGGRSLYLRDPAGNSVELVEGEIWEA
jgi:catechol 2,3-dioxygenase-like lactoylglutathione lyase family enzyme